MAQSTPLSSPLLATQLAKPPPYLKPGMQISDFQRVEAGQCHKSIFICFPKAEYSFLLQKSRGNDDLNASMTSHHFEEESVSVVQYKLALMSACKYFSSPPIVCIALLLYL